MTVPTLVGFEVADRDLEVGDEVSVSYEATDEGGSLQCVIFSFVDEYDKLHQIRADGVVPLSGTVTATVEESWPNGLATLLEVMLCDQSGNAIRYYADNVYKSPSGALGPEAHMFDFRHSTLAVGLDAPKPVAPTDLRVGAGDEAADIAWTAGQPGSPPITAWEVTAVGQFGSPSQDQRITQTVTADGQTPDQDVTTTIGGLDNTGVYRFEVVAINDYGFSEPVVSDPVRIGKVPSTPTGVTTRPLRGQMIVEWTPGPQTRSPVTSYTVTAVPEPGSTNEQGAPADTVTEIASPSDASASLSSLIGGVTYAITVVATNEVGDSDPTQAVTATARPQIEAPEAPSNISVVANPAGEAVVTWLQIVDDGGSPLESYTVTAAPSDPESETETVVVEVDPTKSSGVLAGLVRDTEYLVSVTATNRAGLAATSDVIGYTHAPVMAPDRVAAPKVKVKQTRSDRRRGHFRFVVSWVAPNANNAPIEGYTVLNQKIGSGTTFHDTAGSRTKAVIKKVPKGRYKVRVIARNSAGDSNKSPARKVRAK